jgi:hypothetical protein
MNATTDRNVTVSVYRDDATGVWSVLVCGTVWVGNGRSVFGTLARIACADKRTAYATAFGIERDGYQRGVAGI